ncbi:hypothetical protein OG301_31915 [Streptomyces platensis]|uniref:hypothetical protein n=1 Tax=Streptomyces platensis TaxID=58346 RepID=UPI002E80FFAE|nr:hypothetical protein [Streptomyces platensis]WTI55593.1 hypothetical protein OG301_31915 [Streptomyces platensis]WUB78848.1 hypothetical protein OG424_06445 [Streptomyces platensis]
MSTGSDYPALTTTSRATVWLRRVAVHLGAMHLSGALLVLTFLVPPEWMLDAYGAAPADDPTADVPPVMILLGALFGCVTFHVVVQIPSGLLGSWLGRGGVLVSYAVAVAVAGVLTLVFLWGVVGVADVAELTSLWLDYMARGALALAGYVGLASALRPRPARPSPGVEG